MNIRRAIKIVINNRKLQAVVVALILYFGVAKPEHNLLEQTIERGSLRVAARLGPLSYYEREGAPGGLDYTLLTEFAIQLGVDLEIRLYDNLDRQLESVYSEQIDIAAATLTATKSRRQRFEFSEPYFEVSSVLLQSSSETPKDSIADIISDNYSLEVIAGSSHAEILAELADEHPQLDWQENPEVIMFELMEKVQTGELDYAVVDSSIYELERSMFPRIEVGLQLSEPEPIAFALAKTEDRSLLDALDQFLLDYQEDGSMELLKEAYFLNQSKMDVAGALLFKQRLENRLPEYEPMFREIADQHDYDWLLLAAQAYQESHWEPQARSPTGVRGLMMLTLPTAKQLGITNRLDAEQSLRGGAEYLLSLHGRLPERIPEPDRTKFALAAYNVGFGHLNDARILTQRGAANADSWDQVAKFLPLLRQKKYYSTVRYGYARGSEPVSYVNNIYRFKGILDWHTWQRELETENLVVETKKEEPIPRFYEDVLDLYLSPL